MMRPSVGFLWKVVPWRSVLALLLFFAFSYSSYSQDPDSGRFTGHDSLYRRIETFSSKRKLTSVLYPIVFKAPGDNSTLNCDSIYREHTVPYTSFENKIIRRITVVSLDPFGYRVSDTSARANTLLARTGNQLHRRSLPLTIKSFLLFRKNDNFDSLLIRESERLIRKQQFVREVEIIPELVAADSVDLTARVQDVWSLVPDGSLTGSQLTWNLREQNFFGTGQRFSYGQVISIPDGNRAVTAGYEISNINNTFISANLDYNHEPDGSFLRSVRIDRPFYSPYTRWAGGVLISRRLTIDSISIPEQPAVLQKYRFTTNDYWMGNSWQLFRGRAEFERITNLILTGRWQRISYQEKPAESLDTLGRYSDESFYMLGLAINSRRYIEDRFLFRYGVTEDVPLGRHFGIYGGYKYRGRSPEWYIGGKLMWGDYFSWGYLMSKLEYGTFFNKKGTGEGAFVAGITCLTNLIELGNWHFRQFVKSDLVWGINRFPGETITFNDYMDSGGFDEKFTDATGKFRLLFQSQAYAPWNLLGFRFGPYLVCGLGMAGNEANGFSSSRMYSFVGLGVLIRNDFLNASYFQLSLSFYPNIPGTGDHIFKTNTLRNTEFSLQEFEAGKPDVVGYR